MIGRRGERGSGISVQAARHDDDDNIYQKQNFNTKAILYKEYSISLIVPSVESRIQ